MNDLRRELAPISSDTWEELEAEAKTTLTTYLAARKMVDFVGPKGWDHSAVNLGRVEEVEDAPGEVEARRRQVLPMVELRMPFELSRYELDSVDRGAEPDLDSLVDAARQIAWAEDRIVFHGLSAASTEGVCGESAHDTIPLPSDFTDYPGAISEAINVVRSAGIAGPYAVALSPDCYTGLATTVRGGYPVMQHVQGIVDGPIVWAPALEGAVVMSVRGGDFELTAGRDISIGYHHHDAESVTLYFEESLAFRVLVPEAVVPVQSAD